jgi:hypothetical protein
VKCGNKYEGITICVDSRAAINRLKHTTNGKGQVWAIAWHKHVEQLKNEHNMPVELLWVPAHVGIDGNEEADRWAKMGAAGRGRAGPRFTTLAHIRRNINERKRRVAEESVGVLNQGHHYHSTGPFNGVPRSEKYLDPKTGEEKLRVLPPLKKTSARLTQLRTNHMLCNTYLERIHKLPDDTNTICGFCGSGIQDREHLLMRCSKWKKERKQLLWEVGVRGSREQRRREKKKWSAKRVLEEAKPEALWAWLEATKVGCHTGERRGDG